MTDAHITGHTQLFTLWGTVTDIAPGQISIAGVSHAAGLGNEIKIEKAGETVYGEILSVGADQAIALLFSAADAIRIGDTVQIEQTARVTIGDHWLGQIVNYRGDITNKAAPQTSDTTHARVLKGPPPAAHLRRPLGARLATGMMTTDTLLPICQGQRIGLFAGSGVGKSTLLGKLANGLDADRVVIALIGERSREVQAFANETLPQIGRAHV